MLHLVYNTHTSYYSLYTVHSTVRIEATRRAGCILLYGDRSTRKRSRSALASRAAREVHWNTTQSHTPAHAHRTPSRLSVHTLRCLSQIRYRCTQGTAILPFTRLHTLYMRMHTQRALTPPRANSQLPPHAATWHLASHPRIPQQHTKHTTTKYRRARAAADGAVGYAPCPSLAAACQSLRLASRRCHGVILGSTRSATTK